MHDGSPIPIKFTGLIYVDILTYMDSHLTDKEKQELILGKKLQQFYNLGFINKKQALLFSFYKGIAYGFGIIIGGSVVVGFLLWFLSKFGQVPLIGHFTNSVRQTINVSKGLKN